MRKVRGTLRASLAAGVLLATLPLMPGVAQACGRPPPPPWHVLTGEAGPAVWVGRVTSITPNPAPLRNARLEVIQSTATIERLEAIHGEPPVLYEYVGATSSRAIDGSNYYWCGPRMTVEAGDVVLLIDDPLGIYIFRGSQAEDMSQLESYRFPPEVISRLESYP